jgi:hypothetical protein
LPSQTSLQQSSKEKSLCLNELGRGQIAVISNLHKPYITTVKEAQRLVGNKEAIWDGPKCIQLKDNSKRGLYEKRQSGTAGPMVMQLT